MSRSASSAGRRRLLLLALTALIAIAAAVAVLLSVSGRARQAAAIPLQWWLSSRISVAAVTATAADISITLANEGRSPATVFTTVDCRGTGPAETMRFAIVDPATNARVNAVLQPGEARTVRLVFVDRGSQPDPTHGPVEAGHCRILSADRFGYKAIDPAIAASLITPSP